MKQNILLTVLLITQLTLQSQEMPYTSTTSLEEYVHLPDPISVNNGEVWNAGDVYPIYLDFDITVYDQTYSSINVSAGGGITFAGFGIKSLAVYHTPFGGYQLRDRGVDSSISNIDYEVSGDEGKRIVKIQWDNAGFEQWYQTSDPTDFVDFQIWIFEEDSHIELRFGPKQTDPGTFGYPGGTSDPNRGPSIKFRFDDCSNILSYFSAADNPSYQFFDFCSPNYSFLVDTPSEGITYTIVPNEISVNTEEFDQDAISVFPNPASRFAYVTGIDDPFSVKAISILDYQGNSIKEILNYEIRESQIIVDCADFPSGMYLIQIVHGKKSTIKKLFINHK